MAKNKNETEWVEPLSPECQQWWAAARPKAWWVIQIPYALWHMLLEGFSEGGREGMGWEAWEREGWWGARVGWRGGGGEVKGVGVGGRALTNRSVNGGKGCWWVLVHTPYRRTQPPPPGHREREHRKETRGGTERRTTGDKTQGKTGIRYCRDACIVSAFTNGLVNMGRTSTVFSTQHTNLVLTQRQKSSENEDTDDVSESRWRSQGDRTTYQILPLGDKVGVVCVCVCKPTAVISGTGLKAVIGAFTRAVLTPLE